MAQEIPLCLQVFHSRREFQAQLINRAERIRLKDLQEILKREEKLYIKDYTLFKQRFESRHPTKSLDTNNIRPSTKEKQHFSRRRISSRNSIGSVISAPGKLQSSRRLSRASCLTARLCNGRLSVESNSFNRFQKRRRYLSANDQYVDQHERNTDNNSSKIILGNLASEELNSSVDNNKINNMNGNNLNVNVLITNSADNVVSEQSKTNGLENNVEAAMMQKEVNNAIFPEGIKPDNENPNMVKRVDQFVGCDTSINANELNRDMRANKMNVSSFLISARAMENDKPIQSETNSKKKVTIESKTNLDQNHNAGNGIYDTKSSHFAEEFQHQQTPNGGLVLPIHSLNNLNKNGTTLQMKIQNFLVEQNEFNRLFPKRFDGVLRISSCQKELMSIGVEKREKELCDKKKKCELVLQVLDQLGIEDESLSSNYKE